MPGGLLVVEVVDLVGAGEVRMGDEGPAVLLCRSGGHNRSRIGESGEVQLLHIETNDDGP